MLHRSPLGLVAIVLGIWAIGVVPVQAQITLYNSGGFESFTENPLSPQDNWQTTDFSQLVLDTPAGVIQSGTVFAGTRAVRVIGPNLFDDSAFSNQTFWFQDRTGSPFNPTASGAPIVRTTWRQMMTGSPGGTTNIPFAGVYFEGFNAANTQQQITSVLIDNAERISVITASGNIVSSATIPGLFNSWADLRVDLNFTTQRFSVFLNNVPVSPLQNILFRNSGGITNRLVEFGFQASTQGSGIAPPNDVFYDNYLVMATSIPEPTTYALIGMALAAGGAIWHRRRRSEAEAAKADPQADLESVV